MQNEYVSIIDPVENHIFADRKTSQSWTQIRISPAADIGVRCYEVKPICQRVYEAIGNVNTATFTGDVVPDIVQLRFNFGGKKMRH